MEVLLLSNLPLYRRINSSKSKRERHYLHCTYVFVFFDCVHVCWHRSKCRYLYLCVISSYIDACILVSLLHYGTAQNGVKVFLTEKILFILSILW